MAQKKAATRQPKPKATAKSQHPDTSSIDAIHECTEECNLEFADMETHVQVNCNTCGKGCATTHEDAKDFGKS